MDMPESALNDGLGSGMLILFEQAFFERTCVHSNTDWDAPVFTRVHHFGNFALSADVSGIDPEPVNALLRGFERKTIVEMDIGNQRDPRSLSDPAESFRRVPVG